MLREELKVASDADATKILAAVCRGEWPRVTIDHFWPSALSTVFASMTISVNPCLQVKAES